MLKIGGRSYGFLVKCHKFVHCSMTIGISFGQKFAEFIEKTIALEMIHCCIPTSVSLPVTNHFCCEIIVTDKCQEINVIAAAIKIMRKANQGTMNDTR